jgi:hypothetical protein
MDLESGYREKYNPWPVLDKLQTDRQMAMAELWENLYHQGDVGSASYASVPKLVEAGELILVAAIEVARHSGSNPPIPQQLDQEYTGALIQALRTAPKEQDQLLGFYIIHASVHGQLTLAKALNLLDVEEILSEYG